VLKGAYLGIPTVFDDSGRDDRSDDLICRWTIDDPLDSSQWSDQTRQIVRDRGAVRGPLVHRADTLFGPRTCASLANRIIGWASFPGVRR
jgi:hypothetical protein